MLLEEGVCYDQCILLAKFCHTSVCSPVLCLITTKIWSNRYQSPWRVTILGSWTNRVIALRQISVTALFYLENRRRIPPWSVRACQPKDLKGREWRSVWGRETERGRERERAQARGRGRERESTLAPPFMFFPPPGPTLCKLGLARSAVCSTWSLHSGPRTFFCSIFAGFSLPCLLATTILDSFSLFYLPNKVLTAEGQEWESTPLLTLDCDPRHTAPVIRHICANRPQDKPRAGEEIRGGWLSHMCTGSESRPEV